MVEFKLIQFNLLDLVSQFTLKKSSFVLVETDIFPNMNLPTLNMVALLMLPIFFIDSKSL